MRGCLGLVVDRAFSELWQPLTDHDDCPTNVFGEIYAGLRRFLRDPEPEYVREDDGTIRDMTVGLDDRVSLALSDAAVAEELLVGLSRSDFESESSVLGAVSSTYSVLGDIASDDLANCYLNLLKTFVQRYSLRYYIDDRARFWISFAGFATAMFAQLRHAVETNRHALEQLNAFEHALAECLANPDEIRIKTAIQKQIMALEAFGLRQHTAHIKTLGQMLEDVASWPHNSLNEAAKGLNKFVNDYPGIRHAGTPSSAARPLDLRDLVNITLSLVGLVAYLAEGFDVQVRHAIQGDLATIDHGNLSTAPWLDALIDCTGGP